MRTLRLTIIASLAAFYCVSCKEDPQLVAKRDSQKVEITQLNGEIALIQEKLKHMPAEVAAELIEAKQRAEEQTSEVARLEAEITELQTRKRALQAEFDAYRAKYQTN